MKFNNQTDETEQSNPLKPIIHIIWGALLFLVGVGVFFRIPQVMPKIETIKQFSSVLFFIRFCFYLLGGVLIWGGLKKIYDNRLILLKNKRNSME